MRISDWSSDVCSSDLLNMAINAQDSVAMSATGAQADDRNPIVQALHEMAVTVLGEQLRTMFEKADDILFDSAEKAQSSDEQRLYQIGSASCRERVCQYV